MLSRSYRLQWLVSCALFVLIVLSLLVGALLQQPPGASTP
jgi:hypothetical protein